MFGLLLGGWYFGFACAFALCLVVVFGDCGCAWLEVVLCSVG